MSSTAGSAALLESLKGVGFTSVARQGRLVLLGFGNTVQWTSAANGSVLQGTRFAAHLACPFQLTQGDRLLLCDRDLNRRARDCDDILFDLRAQILQRSLDWAAPRLREALPGADGTLTIRFDHALELQAVPAPTSTQEAWRIFERFGDHLVHPAEADDGPAAPAPGSPSHGRPVR